MTNEQLFGFAFTLIVGLASTVFGLVKYINIFQEKTHREFAAAVNTSLTNFGLRVDKLTEKMDARYDEMWKQIGGLERAVDILRERDAHRSEQMEQLHKLLEQLRARET